MMMRIAALCLSAILVNASPLVLRQAVTEAISPTGSPPPGCTNSYIGTFGIAVLNASTPALPSGAQRRQEGNTTPPSNSCSDSDSKPHVAPDPSPVVVAQISQIADGQIQGGMQTLTMALITQISDGQIQNGVSANLLALPPATATAALDSSAPTIGPVPALTSSSNYSSTVTPTTTSVAPVPSNTTSTDSTNSTTAISSLLVSCRTNSTLALTLSSGILLDSQNRTGYIASNYQFQFDGPPQSGSLYTAGWSVCSNGSLALGGNAIFWQCLSGDFYNLYDRWWAEQCSAVFIRVVGLVDCDEDRS